jgi:hypothetical protein
MSGAVRLVLAACPFLIGGGCGDDEVEGPELECSDSSDATLDSYYDPCTDECPAPYSCVNTSFVPEEPYMACLIPCDRSCDCPEPHGCVGDPDFPVADVAPDGYCAEAP